MNPIKKIKVLEGIRQGKIGGGESYLISLVENLDRNLFEPVVLSFTDGPMIDRLQSQNISTHVIHTETPFDVRVWKKVKQLVEAENIDIVHAHGTRAMSNMFYAAKSKNLPLLYTCHGWSFHQDQNPLVKALRVKSEKFLTSKADINICGAKANRNEARTLFGKFEAEIIYNSIDPQKFNPYNTYKDVRKELNISKDDILIGSVARFTLQKQPVKLVEAFAKVAQQMPNAKLLMVGDGELKADVIGCINRLRLEDKVIMQPFRQDVPDVLAALDIFVLPSLWEGFPIALIEALSMGKAVVATNVDGTPEMIEHGKNGLLVEVKDLDTSLPKALLELYRDADLRSRLQREAISTTYNKYNVQTLAAKNQALYERLTNRSSININSVQTHTLLPA